MSKIFAVFLFLFSLTWFECYAQNRITLEVEPFRELVVSGRIDVELIHASSGEMSITSTNGQPELVEVTFRNEELKLKVPTRINKDDNISIRLPYTELSRIKALAGARINSARDLSVETIELEAGTGGKIELSVSAEKIVAHITQVSDIILYGKAKSQQVSVNTGGNYLAYDLECSETNIRVGSGSQGKVKASAMLDATANTKGYIGYMGDPEIVQTKAILGGKIEHVKSRSEDDY